MLIINYTLHYVHYNSFSVIVTITACLESKMTFENALSWKITSRLYGLIRQALLRVKSTFDRRFGSSWPRGRKMRRVRGRRPFRKRANSIVSREMKVPRRDPLLSLVLITSGASAVPRRWGTCMYADGEKGDAEIHARAGGRWRSPYDLDQFLYRIHEASRWILRVLASPL